MARKDPVELPDELARFAEAQVSSGRFASVGEVIAAGVEALRSRDATDGERARLLRAAWDEGKESMREHGPQLETDEDFESRAAVDQSLTSLLTTTRRQFRAFKLGTAD